MTTDQSARLRMIVAGRVQGVFFRARTREEAARLALCGFARNLPDGSVEIVAEGVRANLELLLAWAYVGPSHARVDRVVTEWAPFKGEFARFEIR